MKKILTIALLLMCFGLAKAQQTPVFNQYMFNKLVVMPSYAGSLNYLNTSVSYRKQYMGFEGAPTTFSFTGHVPFMKNSMGAGLKLIHDQIGVTTESSLSGIYAYHIGLGPGKLSLAIEGSVINGNIDFASLERTHNIDQSLVNVQENIWIPDAAFSAYFATNKFYAGASVFHLMRSKLNYLEDASKSRAHLSQHYYLLMGYAIEVTGDLWLEPSVLGKYVQGALPQADVNLRMIWREQLNVGLGYRTGESVSILGGYTLNSRFRFGYSYGYPINDLQSVQSGSHEIMIQYLLELPEPARKKIIDPRYYY